MKVLYNHWLFTLPFMRNFIAITVSADLILTRFSKEVFDKMIKLQKHEGMHGIQIILSKPMQVPATPNAPNVLYFFVGYFLMFIVCLIRYGKWMKAYSMIPYEIWAREAEGK